MAVTSCQPIHTSGGASGGSRNRAIRTHTVTYLVKVDDTIPTDKVVLDYFRFGGSGGDVPWIGGSYLVGTAKDITTKCRSIQIDYIPNSGNAFNATLEFSTFLPLRDDIQVYSTQYSVAQEAAIFYGAINTRKVSPFLKAGKYLPVTNSAGAIHEPQMEEEIDVKVVRITKTVPEYNVAALERFRGMINTDEVTIDRPDLKFKEQFGPQFGRFRIIGADLYYDEDDVPQWRQTSEIWINPLGWRRNLLDQGTHEKVWPGEEDLSVGDLAVDRRIVDSSNYPVTQPVPLDGNGKELDITNREPVYLVWGTKLEGPFMPLRGIAW